jgi:lysyl-tRNA synthetase class 2
MATQQRYEDGQKFAEINELLKRGDIIGAQMKFRSEMPAICLADAVAGVTGFPAKTNTGELSIVPRNIRLLAPCLHHLPEKLANPVRPIGSSSPLQFGIG